MTDTQQLDDEAHDERDLEWDEYDTEEDLDVDYEDFLDWLNRNS